MSGNNFEEMEDIVLTEKVLQFFDSSRFVSHKTKMSQKFNSKKIHNKKIIKNLYNISKTKLYRVKCFKVIWILYMSQICAKNIKLGC